MARRIWVVSTFSIIAGVYSTKGKALKRVMELGDAEITECEIDKDIQVKILHRKTKIGDQDSRKTFEKLGELFEKAETLVRKDLGDDT